MEQYISKSALVAEIDNMLKTKEQTSHLDNNAFNSGRWKALKKVKDILDTIEVKEVNSVWHNIDDIPNFNSNGISDLIIDSYYGHIYREAHYYTPEKWDTHIGFNTNRQFRWAYEKDLIEAQKGE